MTSLGKWLRRELQKRRLTQNAAAVYAGIGQATLSDILNKGHVPKVETLFRLADFFETPREEILRLAGHLPVAPGGVGAVGAVGTVGAGGTAAAGGGEEEALIRELIEEFRQVPDEWKEAAIGQVAQLRRLAELRPVRVIGEEEEAATEVAAATEAAAADEGEATDEMAAAAGAAARGGE